MGKRICTLLTAATVILLTICLTGTVYAEDSDTGYVYFDIEHNESSDGVFSMTVYINSSEDTSIGGFDILFGYDSNAFSVTTIELGAEFSTAEIQYYTDYNDIRMLWENITSYMGTRAELFTVVFSVKPQAEEGKHDLVLTCNEIYDATPEMNNIPNNCEQGIVAISVWVGERLEITPSDMTLIIGQTGKLIVNKDVFKQFECR